MKIIKNIQLLLLTVLLITSCGEKKETNNDTKLGDEPALASQSKTKAIDIASIKENLCNDFPEDLILKYNPDGKKIEIEPIDDGSGGILGCKIKLFYGEKDYEFWEGLVAANINNMEDPFWQYNPERNPTLYQEVEGLGDRAVFIGNMFQLHILKEGVMYNIVPPNRGRTTNTGKETKAIAVEIAQYYKI